MVYLLKTELKKNKNILLELTKIYGIGNSQAFLLCKKLGLAKNFKVRSLSVEQINALSNILNSPNQILASDLKKLHILTFKKLITIKAYKGLRRLKGLPVRGQRTHTNAKTAKVIR